MANAIPPRDLHDKVAVITGAASGIGLALARHAAFRGMKVALADLGGEKLQAAHAMLAALGTEVIAVPTDVSNFEAVTALNDQVTEALGPPWLVANNAGITQLSLSWNHSLADWRRMFDINVHGVIHGLLAFLPGLRERNQGHIINTASAAGLLCIPAASAYVASKHAVVGLSETLYRELVASHSEVGLSVLCPALVKTNILGAAHGESAIDSAHALSPEEVARQVFDAIEIRRFWVLTHAEQMAPYMRARLEQMISQSNPDAASRDPDVAHTASKATGLSFIDV